MNMQNLMAQAQKMQKDILNKKEEFNKKEFVEEYEFITITATGDKKIKKITINKENINKEEIEMLEDFICITWNNLVKKIDQNLEKEMGQYGSLGGIL